MSQSPALAGAELVTPVCHQGCLGLALVQGCRWWAPFALCYMLIEGAVSYTLIPPILFFLSRRGLSLHSVT